MKSNQFDVVDDALVFIMKDIYLGVKDWHIIRLWWMLTNILNLVARQQVLRQQKFHKHFTCAFKNSPNYVHKVIMDGYCGSY